MTERFTYEFSEKDIEFLIEVAGSSLLDRIDIIKDDPTFIENIIEARSFDLLQRIMLMDPDKITVTVTPRLLFEVLLRSARKEMATRTYTMERTGGDKIPIFDAPQAHGFIKDDTILKYVADMLTSFTRIKSFTWPVRVRKGLWRRIRFNDMDLDSLIRFCESVEEERRFEFYKRIGDLCLFILGMFPEYLAHDARFSSSSGRFTMFGRKSRSAEEYEEEGRRFYKLAGEHRDACILGLDNVFRRLHDNFRLATKPLNYISDHYLLFQRGKLFTSTSSD
jgi:hypothetical protein